MRHGRSHMLAPLHPQLYHVNRRSFVSFSSYLLSLFLLSRYISASFGFRFALGALHIQPASNNPHSTSRPISPNYPQLPIVFPKYPPAIHILFYNCNASYKSHTFFPSSRSLLCTQCVLIASIYQAPSPHPHASSPSRPLCLRSLFHLLELELKGSTLSIIMPFFNILFF